MTHNKTGQDPPIEESTNVPIHEARPVTKDGPEGYMDDEVVRQFEDDQTKVPNTSSANTRSAVTGSLGSDGVAISDSLRPITKGVAIKPCPFGSPFAYLCYQDKPDFFKGLLAESTRILFDQVVAEASTLRRRLSRGVALTNAGSNGPCCVLKKPDSSSTISDTVQESNSGDSQLKVYCFESNENGLKLSVDGVFYYADSKASSLAVSESSNSDTILDVRRVRDPKTGEIEYFILNKGSGPLSVNGIDVDHTVRAGPLPDFAVLELGQSSIFWWRTAAALYYMPSLKRKRDADDNDEGSFREAFKGDGDPSPESPVFLNSKRWLDEYRRRVALCEERPNKHTSSVTDVHPPHELPDHELRETDVILAIGAVWLGLINAKIDFAYANSKMFSLARSMRTVGMHAVKGTNHFLMPLLFNKESEALSPESVEDTVEPLEPVFSAYQRGEEEKNQEKLAAAEKAKQKDSSNIIKPPLSLNDQEAQNQNIEGDIGHFVLAVAEKVNRDGPSTIEDTQTKKASVRLRIMDSGKGKVDKRVVRRVARNIVRNSGWLDDTWPFFEVNEENWTEVIGQSNNRSGEHTVLNAWAYMLEIPLAVSRERKLGSSSYKEVRRMIRLALQGKLDSLTIRAWMQHSDYAVDEPLSQLQQSQTQNPGLRTKLRNMHTVALNRNAFNQIVDDIYTQEQGTKQGYAALWGAVSLPSEVVTTGQSGHAPKVATGVTLLPSDQGSGAAPSVTSGISGMNSGSATTPLTLETWQQRLDQGLAYQKESRAKTPRTTGGAFKRATKIKSASNMADDDVVLGIAPIWEGIKRLRRADVDFAYAGLDVFSPGGLQQGVGAVGGRNRFIMPLLFSSTKAEKIGSVGHLLLCVAELVNVQPLAVHVQVFDSLQGFVLRDRIAQMVQKIIHDSDWLGTKGRGAPFPHLTLTNKRVPQQVGINTCGLHVIFNAWAIMLGIPIHPHNLRRGRSDRDTNDATDHRFIKLGLEIVNLALEGFMDSTTIQAFFNVYGYSVEQRFGDRARSVIPFNAVGMNMEKFRRTLQKRYWGHILDRSKASNRNFSDAAIARLTGHGLTPEQAWAALTIAGGNFLEALQWHFGRDEPEDALSPKTPDRRKKALSL